MGRIFTDMTEQKHLKFHWKFTVLEIHLDTFGHMNHATYLQLFEQARWDLITERGFGIDVIRQTRTGPTILEITMRFMRELNARDAVVIRTEMLSYERKIGKLRQQIIKADGTVGDLSVAESSGHALLDQEALVVMRKASPLTLKHQLEKSQITILVPISYRLEG